MRRYETIYIARPGSGEKEIESITERTTQTITSNDGSIVRIDNWGIKKLAYPIKKEQQGYYVYIEYAGLPDSVAEIERLFRIDDKVLKYLTVKTQDVYSHIPSDDEPEKSEESESVAEEASQQNATEKPEGPEIAATDAPGEVAEEETGRETSAEKPEEPQASDESPEETADPAE